MDKINKRCLYEAKLILSENMTVRKIAKLVGFCKSTVHTDLTVRLKQINYKLYLDVKQALEYNKSIRHIRGGEATRLKYLKPQ